MFKALNMNDEIISIEQAEPQGNYRCPFCKGEMIVKIGNIKVHHFAHKNKICDDWYSENKGIWHRYMQNLFKKEYQEVVLWKDGDKNSGEFHIADICIPRKDGSNLIIKFQHSPMSYMEFDTRNDFYISDCVMEGHKLNKIIWIFDYRDKQIFLMDKDKNPLNKLNTNYVKALWKRQSSTLLGCNVSDSCNNEYSNIIVVFHVRLKQWDNIRRINEGYDTNGEYHYNSYYIKEFTGETGEAFFVKPTYNFDDWKYFGGKVTKEFDFIKWARNQ